jgi:hypothetical protein
MAKDDQHFAQTIKADGRAKFVKMVDESTVYAVEYIVTVCYPAPRIGKNAFDVTLAGRLGNEAKYPHTA